MADGNKKAVILTVGGFEHGYLEKERLEGLLLRKLFSLQTKISFLAGATTSNTSTPNRFQSQEDKIDSWRIKYNLNRRMTPHTASFYNKIFIVIIFITADFNAVIS